MAKTLEKLKLNCILVFKDCIEIEKHNSFYKGAYFTDKNPQTFERNWSKLVRVALILKNKETGRVLLVGESLHPDYQNHEQKFMYSDEQYWHKRRILSEEEVALYIIDL